MAMGDIRGGRSKPANERQIGGAHYAGEYQHWDFVREVLGNNYLLGCATKYVSRWRKKNGVEDLEKALHYIDKAEETCVAAFGAPEVYVGRGSFVMSGVLRFAGSASCDIREAQVLWYIASAAWGDARDMINIMIAKASELGQKGPTPQSASQAATGQTPSST